MPNKDHPMPSGFHDTSLVGASHEGSTISLNVEYYTEDDIEASMKAFIQGVEKITRDGAPIPEFLMETSYGSIVMLEMENEHIAFYVKWIDFSTRTDTPCFYRMFGSEVRLLRDFRDV